MNFSKNEYDCKNKITWYFIKKEIFYRKIWYFDTLIPKFLFLISSSWFPLPDFLFLICSSPFALPDLYIIEKFWNQIHFFQKFSGEKINSKKPFKFFQDVFRNTFDRTTKISIKFIDSHIWAIREWKKHLVNRMFTWTWDSLRTKN